MEKIKENALEDYIEMIQESWTYDRMNDTEKQQCIDTLRTIRTTSALKGNYYARWNILQAVYGAYLSGLGYNGGSWRENE